MAAGPRRTLSLALACLALAPAAASASPAPPSAAEFERQTERLLDDPGFRARGGSGGLDPDGPDDPTFGDLLFPDNVLLTLYGAPQLERTILGRRSVRGAARELERRARPFERRGERPVVPGFDLIAVVANATPGPDRKYRTRQPDELIAAYLETVRELGGRLMLDIQPGRSTALDEIIAMKRWVVEPDVDVAIDPEWNVGPRGVPGKTTGRITAEQINQASLRLDRIVENENLPPKVLVVHQFTRRMVKGRARIKQRPGVQVAMNFDGIGTPAAKEAGYGALATEGLFNGFSVFLLLDSRVMGAAAVLGLLPTVDFLMLQ